MYTEGQTIQDIVSEAEVMLCGDRILLKLEPGSKVTRSGLHIPETAQDKGVKIGRIVGVGPGRLTEKGDLIPILNLARGDRVAIAKFQGDDIEIEGIVYRLVRYQDVLLKFKEKQI